MFNLVEGIIDHEVLQLHHVYQNGDHLLWDMVFLCRADRQRLDHYSLAMAVASAIMTSC